MKLPPILNQISTNTQPDDLILFFTTLIDSPIYISVITLVIFDD